MKSVVLTISTGLLVDRQINLKHLPISFLVCRETAQISNVEYGKLATQVGQYYL